MRLREFNSRIVAGIALTVVSQLAFAQGVTVQPGASLAIGNGQIDLGCGDLSVGGQVSINSGSATGLRHVDITGGTMSVGMGTVLLSGDWSNAGTFNAGAGEVVVDDGCGTADSVLAGDNAFFDFTVTSALGKILWVESASLQQFANSLTLVGDVADRLLIRSTDPGLVAFFSLDPVGVQSIWAVDVRDNDASGGQTLAQGTPEDFESVDSGNNVNWFIAIMDMIFKHGFE